MNFEIDISNAPVNKYKMYGGKSGNKLCIVYNNENYMLKFPPQSNRNPKMSYKDSSICEHISCKIFSSLGFNTQDTFLCTYKGKLAVACKDFEINGFSLFEFAHLKNTLFDTSTSGYDTVLPELLNTIDSQTIYNKDTLTSFFWDMFATDALLGNWDRHNGNWGFLINESKKLVELAPIFDCGSCLYPQMDNETMILVLSDYNEVKTRLYDYPFSAIRNENGTKIRYFSFISETDNIDCINAMLRLSNNIDLNKINYIIDNTPYISELHKDFYKMIIKERKINLIDLALQRNALLSHDPNFLNSKSINNALLKPIKKNIHSDPAPKS